MGRRLRTKSWPDVFHLQRQRSGSEISPAFLVSATHGGWLSGKSLTHPCIIKIFPYLDKISWGSKILYFKGLILSCKIIISERFNPSVEWDERNYRAGAAALRIRLCNKPSMAAASQAKTICKAWMEKLFRVKHVATASKYSNGPYLTWYFARVGLNLYPHHILQRAVQSIWQKLKLDALMKNFQNISKICRISVKVNILNISLKPDTWRLQAGMSIALSVRSKVHLKSLWTLLRFQLRMDLVIQFQIVKLYGWQIFLRVLPKSGFT